MATIKTEWFNQSDLRVSLLKYVPKGFTFQSATTDGLKITGTWAGLPNIVDDEIYTVVITMTAPDGRAAYAFASIGVLDDLTTVTRITGGVHYQATYYDADTIRAGSGNDILQGFLGADKLYGGSGQDKLYGGYNADTLYGQDGNDLLKGDSGSDKLYGGNGTDTLYGGTGDDTLNGDAGNDKLYGDVGNDTLFGGSGNDTLSGGSGTDYLLGDAGRDILTGGAGTDVFVFRSHKDSLPTSTGMDVIMDFSLKDDYLDVSYMDANTKLAGNQAFAFLGTKGFDGKAGEIRYEKKSGDTFVYADLNGDKKADLGIQLDGQFTLTKGDFIL